MGDEIWGSQPDPIFQGFFAHIFPAYFGLAPSAYFPLPVVFPEYIVGNHCGRTFLFNIGIQPPPPAHGVAITTNSAKKKS